MTTRDGRLRLTLLGPGNKPLQDVVDIWMEHEKLTDKRVFRSLDASEVIIITDLYRTPQGLYKITVRSRQHGTVGQFLNIEPSGGTELKLSFSRETAAVQLDLLGGDREARTDFDVAEPLSVRAGGLRPHTAYDLDLLDEKGTELLSSRILSNGLGEIEPSVLWPQLGLEDPTSDRPLRVEEARERWKGKQLRLRIRSAGKTVREAMVRFADTFSRPVLVGTDMDGVVVNGFEAGARDALVSAYSLPVRGRVRVFLVPRQHDWQTGNRFTPVTLASGRPAFTDVEVGEDGNFRARLARARELAPGPYDFIVRPLRYGYEDDEDFVLRSNDVVTRAVTGLVVRQEFMASKAVLGGCVNAQREMAGRKILGPPYFEFSDSFNVGEDIYASLDPAALNPNMIGKKVSLYVIKHKEPSVWATDKTLTHLAELGGNGAVQQFVTQSGCINYNVHKIWGNAQTVGEYDIVADFGNDGTFDSPNDIIDGYFLTGFRVVPDPTTDTSFAYYGTYQYDETTYGSTTVTNDYGSQFAVPLRAVVRFPADAPGKTSPAQISGAQSSYPLAVVVHGQGHDYQGYDYLLNHWALNGFIAASIHLVNAGGNQTGSDRALVLFEHLKILKTLFGSKAADNIGILGHSRGGEGVTIAPRLNQQQATVHGIHAVVALAPTNQYTDEVLGGAWATPYLVIYGSMDGDVNGQGWASFNTALNNCGFALYDKANGAKKSMVFAYGADHDRFTTIGTETDYAWLGPTDKNKVVSAATHRKIALAYTTAFFRWQLKNESQWKGLFRGEWLPPAVAAAEPAKLKLYFQYEDTVRTEVDNFEGTHSATSWQTSTVNAAVDDDNTLPVDPLEDALNQFDNHSPHETAGLLLRWNDVGDRLRFEVPAQFKNVQTAGYKAVSFRITQKVGSGSNPPGQAQDLYLTLEDTASKKRSIKVSKFAEIPPPHPRDTSSLTKSALCTVRIPLHVFQIEVLGMERVDLKNVKSLTFDFKASGQGEVEIDSVEFTQ